jgi:predicted nucleic acid-binding protein
MKQITEWLIRTGTPIGGNDLLIAAHARESALRS